MRITYGPLAPSVFSLSKPARLSDLVEHEPIYPTGGDESKEGDRRDERVRYKSVSGIDTATKPEDTSSWSWRGTGGLLLYLVESQWEVLGWGERMGENGEVVERWVVTWFRETGYTEEGVDLYSDLREGGSQELVEAVMGELRSVVKGVEGLEGLVEGEMREVERRLPWVEREEREEGGWGWYYLMGGLAVVATVAMYVSS